jgi:GNAT superfamily N-acetyltransferase
MELREFGPDDATAIRSFVELKNAVRDTDSPWRHLGTPYRLEMEMRHGWDGEVARYFLAAAGGTVVGGVEVSTSEYDNLDLAWLGVDVHPAHRRNGHGTAMLEAAYDVCRSMNRSLVGIDGWEGAQTSGFAAATGWERKSQAINRRQHLKELEPGLAQVVHDEAVERADDYELVRIHGLSPDELLDQLSQVSAAINDAPLDDLELEEEAFPPERIRAYELAQEASGIRLYRIVARHRSSGELGGHTVVAVDTERPHLGEQHDTAVARDHRGHRLGALLKADMMLWMAEEESQLDTIDTWNAESNGHMVGINERLGYRIIGRELQFQRRL